MTCTGFTESVTKNFSVHQLSDIFSLYQYLFGAELSNSDQTSTSYCKCSSLPISSCYATPWNNQSAFNSSPGSYWEAAHTTRAIDLLGMKSICRLPACVKTSFRTSLNSSCHTHLLTKADIHSISQKALMSWHILAKSSTTKNATAFMYMYVYAADALVSKRTVLYI